MPKLPNATLDTATTHQRLRDLIAIAESAPELSLPDPDSLAHADSNYLKSLKALRAWFEEWSSIARVAIRRRDYLIRMGLTKRHVQPAAPASSASPAPQAS